MGDMTEEEFANLSDDDLMGMAIPPSIARTVAQEETNDDAELDQETAASNEAPAETGGAVELGAAGDDPAADESGDGDPDDGHSQLSDEELGSSDRGARSKPAAKTETAADANNDAEQAEGGQKAVTAETASAEEADYKGFYEKIMTPFKANGREIKLENPDEAIRLMQMGANYTKKLQSLQPNLKLMRMLEDAKLLDESKLSFLIDLQNKNPSAITKLLKDANIDPLDLDTRTDNAYTPKSYAVSDREHNFRTALDEMVSTQEGKAVVTLINQTWDAASKERIWDDPEILRVMLDHKQSGAYDQIAGEVARRQTVGTLPSAMSFLQAYQQVGTEMAQRAQQTQSQTGNGTPEGNPAALTKAGETPTGNQKKVLAVGAAPSNKPVAAVDPRVKAAMPSRGGSPAAKPADFDIMQLSDDEFAKLDPLKGRL